MVEGATKVRPEEAPAKAKEQRVEQTSNLVEPAKTKERPQALAPGEDGRLGKRPPRAAKAEKEVPSQPKAAQETKPEKKGKTVERGPEQGKPKQGKKAAKEGKPEREGGPSP